MVIYTAPNNPLIFWRLLRLLPIIIAVLLCCCVSYFCTIQTTWVFIFLSNRLDLYVNRKFFFPIQLYLVWLCAAQWKNKRISRDATIFYRSKYSNCKAGKQLFLSKASVISNHYLKIFYRLDSSRQFRWLLLLFVLFSFNLHFHRE